MKNLTSSLSLIMLLASSQIALAETANRPVHTSSNIETITVVATPEVGNFEIFSEKLSASSIQKVMDIVASNLNGGRAKKANNTAAI
jgi:hypothetical protein